MPVMTGVTVVSPPTSTKLKIFHCIMSITFQTFPDIFGTGWYVRLTPTVTLAWSFIYTLTGQQYSESLTGIPKIPPGNTHRGSLATLLLAGFSFSFVSFWWLSCIWAHTHTHTKPICRKVVHKVKNECIAACIKIPKAAATYIATDKYTHSQVCTYTHSTLT